MYVPVYMLLYGFTELYDMQNGYITNPKGKLYIFTQLFSFIIHLKTATVYGSCCWQRKKKEKNAPIPAAPELKKPLTEHIFVSNTLLCRGRAVLSIMFISCSQ